MSNHWKDPRRIALIAVRTGSGAPLPNSDRTAEAIVVGEVPVDPNGAVVDPTANPGPPTFSYEWRYACFNLPDLQNLLRHAQQDFLAGKKWTDIAHPLRDPD